MDYTLENLRQVYGADQIGVYLNTPANGLMSSKIETKVNEELKSHLLSGSLGFNYFMSELFPKVKLELAKFIKTTHENVALMPNFSFAHLALLSGIPKSTKIALIGEDYPSICTPFEQGGYDVSVFFLSKDGLDYDRFVDFLKAERTEVLAISHVQFLSGYKVDVPRISKICRDLNIYLMLDVTQSLGYVDIDVMRDQIDVVAGSCYKWLNAGYGTGFMAVSGRFQERFKARMGGFMSYRMTDDGSMRFENSMANYEPGNLNPENYARLSHCLEEKTQVGVKLIEKHNSDLLQYALTKIDNQGIELPDAFRPEERGAFARVPGDDNLMAVLEDTRIYTALRGGYLRFGCHFYNNRADMDRFLEIYLSRFGNS